MDNNPQAAITSAATHVPQMVLSKDVQPQVHGDGPLGRFNARLAVGITKSVGSMWCAYIFVLLALISFPAAITSGNVITIVSWIAQTFLQLVLLPIIIVGQNISSAASDKRAESDHKTLLAIHMLTREVHHITEQQTKMLQYLEDRSVNSGGSGAPTP